MVDHEPSQEANQDRSKFVIHGRYATFQMAEIASHDNDTSLLDLRLIANLRSPRPCRRDTLDGDTSDAKRARMGIAARDGRKVRTLELSKVGWGQ